MKPKRRSAIVHLAIAATLAALATVCVGRYARAEEPPAVDPAAMDALKGMGAYLRTLKAFQVEAVTTDEDVLDDGQKILYSGTVNILARMPNGLLADVRNDRRERVYVYDGKNFSLVAKRMKLYATVAAPPTIGELANKLDQEYGYTVPLADLFRWGTPGWSTEGITAAMDVGPSPVGGVTCEQYAFRQADIDWQVWIQKGDFPLPRRIVITSKTDEARPQHTAVFTWNLAPSFNDQSFVFTPPADAAQAALAKLPAAAAGK